MRIIYLSLVALLAAGLSGCATQPVSQAVFNHNASVQAHNEKMLTAWQAVAKSTQQQESLRAISRDDVVIAKLAARVAIADAYAPCKDCAKAGEKPNLEEELDKLEERIGGSDSSGGNISAPSRSCNFAGANFDGATINFQSHGAVNESPRGASDKTHTSALSMPEMPKMAVPVVPAPARSGLAEFWNGLFWLGDKAIDLVSRNAGIIGLGIIGAKLADTPAVDNTGRTEDFSDRSTTSTVTETTTGAPE